MRQRGFANTMGWCSGPCSSSMYGLLIWLLSFFGTRGSRHAPESLARPPKAVLFFRRPALAGMPYAHKRADYRSGNGIDWLHHRETARLIPHFGDIG